MRTVVSCTAILSAIGLFNLAFAQTIPYTKAQVSDRIREVENGVDHFEKYLATRSQNASNKADSTKNKDETSGQRKIAANKDARMNQPGQTKDDLQNAVDNLTRTTERLRRKFDPMSIYTETRVQMAQVMNRVRRIDQVVGKGNDGQAKRLWAALRASINDLASCYELAPIGG